MIHRCDIRTGYRTRVRILAARENVRGPIGDFAVRLIWQDGDKVSFADAVLTDFPRGMGVDGLFGAILSDIARRDGGATDENGIVVPVPEPTDDDLRRLLQHHYQLYHAAGKELLKRNPSVKRSKR